MRAHVPLCLCAASVGLLLFAACTTDYQLGLEDPNYGNANALAGQRQPGPTSEVVTDGGGGGGGGGGTKQNLCTVKCDKPGENDDPKCAVAPFNGHCNDQGYCRPTK